MDQRTGSSVFKQPQRAIRTLFHIADALAYIPALGGFGAALSVKDDAVERRRPHAADEAAVVPLRKGLRAAVEHQTARRDHWHPIDHRLGQFRLAVGVRDRDAVIVLTIGDERPAIILAFLDQVQLVAATRAMLYLPQFAGG